MSQQLRLLFDECVGRPLVDSLATMLAITPDPPEIKHILEFFASGTHDEVWVPQIAAGGWIVITGDRGKGGRSKGEKLPIVCEKYQVTHVMFSLRLHSQNSFEKTRAVLSAWKSIQQLPRAPKGSAWMLRYTSAGGITLQKKEKKDKNATKKDRK